MRIVFMGTPEFACPTLSRIIQCGHNVVAVYARAPKPFGRGMRAKISPVHARANDSNIPVFTPLSFKADDTVEAFRDHAADAAVVVAYGLILPPAILSAPRHGCLNLHASLLPRWRGAAPIQRAIMAGDRVTGIAVMRMAEGLDTGPIAMLESVAISEEMTAGELHDELAQRGAELIMRALSTLENGKLDFVAQSPEGVRYASKIDNGECRINWSAKATVVHNHIRGLSPVPGAFFEADVGRGRERLKVLRSRPSATLGNPGEVLDDALTVGCGDGSVTILQLQRAGRVPMTATEFLRGTPVSIGTKLY
jgi:methionyl-tRNA formyltransferase